MKYLKKIAALSFATLLGGAIVVSGAGCAEKKQTVVLRVCNWEEYIDLGDWDSEELIDIDNPFSDEGEGVFGDNSIVDDFTEWFNAEHDYKVEVEYSTFGTNEDLYNRLSLGDEYDLVCPSDYMLMKLIDEGNYVPFSEEFLDADREGNYYAQGVSRYIDCGEDSIFVEYGWSGIAACYMWGTTGLVYNPEQLQDVSDVASWDMLANENYKRQVTIKDNVRDAYFATLGIINSEKLKAGLSAEERSTVLNDTDDSTIAAAEDMLKRIKENVYSFETDSGKADMVTGKVIANLQWSGDAVYIMDEADAEETELWYSVPDECTNLWFDGWLMLKDGVEGNERRQQAAEAFVNFLSRPDNAVRNMYYIGYTSAVADGMVFDYMDWNYGAEEDEEEIFEYDLSYFFGEGYSLTAGTADFEFEDGSGAINRGRQLFAQYPPANVIERSVVMLDFGDRLSVINGMWINVRCLDVKDISPVVWGVVSALAALSVGGVCLYVFRYKLFIKSRPKKGYEKIENK